MNSGIDFANVDKLEQMLHDFHQEFGAKKDQNRRAAAKYWEFLSELDSTFANLDMSYGSLTEKLDQLLQEALNILVGVQSMDQNKDVKMKIQEIETKARKDGIEMNRIKDGIENIRKEIASSREEIRQEMDKLQKQNNEPQNAEVVKEEDAPAK